MCHATNSSQRCSGVPSYLHYDLSQILSGLKPSLRRRLPRRKTVAVRSINANRTSTSRAIVLEEAEVRIVRARQACHACAGTDEARPNINGVRIAWLHVHRWEGREGPRGRLVVVCRLWAGTAAGVVAREEEGAAARVGVGGGCQLGLAWEEELEGAIGVGAGGGNVEGKDRGDVVGGEDAVVLWAVGLVGLGLGNLCDVVWELVLAGFQGTWAAGAFVDVGGGEGALAQDLAWVGEGGCGQQSKGEDLHDVRRWGWGNLRKGKKKQGEEDRAVCRYKHVGRSAVKLDVMGVEHH